MAKDGGPAFPYPFSQQDGNRGMTLRDYFAASVISNIQLWDNRFEFYIQVPKAAEVAYAIAEAMLAEREKVLK